MTEPTNAQQIPRATQDHGGDRSRLEATEGQPSGQDSDARGEGVQRGGRSEGQAQEEVACAYAVTVDGFIAVNKKAIRNLESPFLVWMPVAIWQRLATCATTQGQFYIPCTPTMYDASVLRAHVAELTLQGAT